MKSKSATLTPQELEIMKVVWQKGEATVRDVYEDLLERRKIAYTTVMTMMKVLEGQGAPPRNARTIGPTSTSPRVPRPRSCAAWSASSWTGCSTAPPTRSWCTCEGPAV